MTDTDDDPYAAQPEMINESLALTSQVLHRRGFVDQARAMERVVRHEVDYQSDWNQEVAVLFLEYEPEDESLFKQHEDSIRDVWFEMVRRKRYEPEILGAIDFREVLPVVSGGWREQLAEILRGERRSNHARKVREEDPRWTEDNLFFTNGGELQVYRALKRRQENTLPAGETIGIYPLSRGRVRGATREPDLIVTYRGRAGIIEVDGPHHNVRRANDMTRDELFRDAGAAETFRIPVEALQNPDELEGHIDRVLRRLGGH